MNQNNPVFVTGGKVPADKVFNAQHFINGQWLDSADKSTLEIHSPAHGTLVSKVANGGRVEAESAIKAARQAFDKGDWPFLPGKEKAALLLKVADMIEANQTRIARIETLESGKPISQAEAEIAGAADIWRYAASLARTMHGDSHNTLGGDMLGLVLKEPIGVVSMITPWNFPFLIISQKLPFALAAGCTCVIKPSELTPSTTTILAELLGESGLPAGVANIVHGLGNPVGNALTTHPDIDMVTFTGSTAVGKVIEKASADSLKKVSSELGGKNPQVIFDDANIDEAIDAIVFGIYFNAGECCNSGSRIIVHQDIKQQVIEKVAEHSRRVAFGDPLNSNTKVGAIIHHRHLDKIDGFVKRAVKAGATIELGGEPVTIEGLNGKFYLPTVLSGVTSDMEIATEEVFGPVLSILTFTTIEEAIQIANSVNYGLSAGIWSENIHKCLEFARRVKAGTVWTNTWMDGYAELPFGGFKESGQGRELGHYGLEEYLEVKTVQMRIGSTRTNWVD